MRTYNSEDKYDISEAKRLSAEPWQLEVLSKNPDYTCWGNWEDYMAKTGDSGWDKPVEIKTVDDLFGLNDYNEVVNFYFNVTRDNVECPHCEGTSYNKETRQLDESWYSFDKCNYISLPNNRRYNDCAWQYHLTEVEVEALLKAGRLWDFVSNNCRFDEEDNTWKVFDQQTKTLVPCDKPVPPSPQAVNDWAKSGLGHDSINRMICVEARAKHLGVYGHCEHCSDGRIYSGKAKLGLQMWVLHPRKGASRGVYLHDIKKEELPKVITYLKEAAERNADRFSKL